MHCRLCFTDCSSIVVPPDSKRARLAPAAEDEDDDEMQDDRVRDPELMVDGMAIRTTASCTGAVPGRSRIGEHESQPSDRTEARTCLPAELEDGAGHGSRAVPQAPRPCAAAAQ